MPPDELTEDIGGILVSVEPQQSSYFAGEPFSAKITFTNTRPVSISSAHNQAASTFSKTGIAVPPRPSSAAGSGFKHKRGAHSITYGSAPLANPPTSPGAPHFTFASSTPSLSHPHAVNKPNKVTRKGLIGRRPPSFATERVDAMDSLPLGPGSAPLSPEQRRLLSRRTHSVDVLPPPPLPSKQEDLQNGKDDGKPLLSPVQSRVHPPSPLSRTRSDSSSSNATTSTTSITPSPLSRSSLLNMSRSHPHARKQSVVDGHLPHVVPQSIPSSSSWGSNTSPLSSTPPHIISPSPSNALIPSSSFALALDPINEASNPQIIDRGPTSDYSDSRNSSQSTTPSPAPSDLYRHNGNNGTIHGVNDARSPYPGANNTFRQSSLSQGGSGLGLGQPPGMSAQLGRSQSQTTSPNKTAVPRTAFSSTFSPPNTEVLLWSYAQLLGIMEVEEGHPTIVSPDAVNSLRSKLNTPRGGVVGGGRMDIGSVSPGGGLLAGSRTRRSFISSFLGGSSSTDTAGPSTGTLGLGLTALSTVFMGSPASSPLSPMTRSPMLGEGLSSSMAGVSGGLPPNSIPTFETQPSVLAVDLNLAPGESRTYTYSLDLPDVLPPTFRGKAVKLSYYLVVGTSRPQSFPIAPSPVPGSASSSSAGQRSKVMRVPIRLYNYVSAGRSPQPYDLLWPLARRRMGPIKCKVDEGTHSPASKRPALQKPATRRGSKTQFNSFVTQMLSNLADREGSEDDDARTAGTATIRGLSSHSMIHGSPSSHGMIRNLDDDQLGADSGLGGCRESVEILTRVSKKVSYDINKDGVKVAVLTFVKSAYRLGETVMCVVEFNNPDGRGRVLKFSAMLEAHEAVPSALSQPSAAYRSRGLRRIHAEHHASMVLDSLRVPFNLDIPSDASPGFRVGIEDSDSGADGGLEWKVRMTFLVAMGGEDGSGTRHLVRDGLGGEWGHSWKATPSLAPLSRGGTAIGGGGIYYRPSTAASATSSAWSLFSSRSTADVTPLGDSAQEGDWDWREASTETVECEVGITVWPGNTLYKPALCDFEV